MAQFAGVIGAAVAADSDGCLPSGGRLPRVDPAAAVASGAVSRGGGVVVDERSSADDAAPDEPPRPRRSRIGHFARSWLLDLAAVSAASAVITVWLFRLWSAPLRAPLDYVGDGLAQLSVTQGIVETGWNVSNPRLGAPTGYVSYDFPAGSDNLHWLGLKVLSWFSDDAVLVTNAFFFASFVAVAVVAFVVLRVLGLPRWMCHAAALLFTFLPFHAARGIAHLALANYVSVPLGCLLVLWAAQGQPVFFGRDGWRTPRSIAVVGICIVLGMAGVYYAVFTVVLLAAATAIALLAPGEGRRWAPLASAATVVTLIGASFFVNTVPALRYQADNGGNPGVAVRDVWEVDDYALRPVALVAPVRGHLIGPLDDLGAELRQVRNGSEPTMELGALGSIGLVLAGGSLVAAAAGRRRLLGIDPGVGVLIVAAVVMGVVGGFSWFTSLAGLDEIRSWNRISVVIGFLALYALAVALTHVVDRRLAPPVTAALAVGLVVVGVVDQVPRSTLRTTESFVATWQADEAFFTQVDDQLPPDAMVFELPRLSYPEEAQVDGEAPQELFKPYLHTRDLNFSFGGMRGRESDWQEQASPPVAAVPDFLDTIGAVGFSGVLVDREAYTDGGVAIERELVALLGDPLAISAGLDWAFYDLRPYANAYRARVGDAAATARAQATLAQPTMWWSDGFAFQDRAPDLTVSHRAASEATSVVVNHTDQPWRGTLGFTVRSDQPGPFTLRVGEVSETMTAASATPVEIPLELEPGERAELRWITDAPAVAAPGDPRALAFTVADVRFTPAPAP